MPHAERNGARIHWTDHGAGEPLLLVMGYGLSSDAWTPMLPLLEGYRAIRFDNLGTGQSDAPRDAITIHTMAADAAAVLDDAGVDRAHVHGVSMGGMIAQALALDMPDRVATLVLGCTTPAPLRFFDVEGSAQLLQGSMLARTDPDAGLDMLLPVVFSATFLQDNPSVRDLARQLIGAQPMSEEALLAMTRAIGDMTTGQAFDVSDRLGDIRVPTLVQHGSADRIIPVEAGRFLAEHIPGAEYQEFEGAGHAYGLERAVEAFSGLIGFLKAHPLAA